MNVEYGKLWVSVYSPLSPIIIALKFELIISRMATSVDGGVPQIFRFNDQLLRPVLPLFNFKPRIFEAKPRNPSFSMIRDI